VRRILIFIVLVAGSLVLLPESRAFAAASRTDFNGDGIGDLAVGVPREDVGGISDAGAVEVLYGSGSGLSASGDQFWNQDSSGVPEDAETDDEFGSAVANGDFDSDGFSDLAIGVPHENVGGDADAGAVNVLYGSATGLSADGAQLWTQDETGVAGDGAEAGDYLGASLATGDFNGDGFFDLAVAVPDEDIGGVVDAGAVNVLYGSSAGLTATGDQFWSQDSSGVAGSAESEDVFGSSLAAADFGAGSRADLAIGVAGEGLGGLVNAGAVNVLYGSSGGLSAVADQLWTQDSTGVADTAESGDAFGWSLAAANLGKSSQADLAIGAPFEDLGATNAGGAVNVLYGGSAGLSASGDQQWTQNSSGINGTGETADDFGWSLAAANFGKSSQADLAIGAFNEDLGGATDAGSVNVIYGTSTGLSAAGDQLFTQDSSGVAGTAETGDYLGEALTAANYGNGSQADLAIGVPGQVVGGDNRAGAANVLYGSSTGLTSSGNQLWTQDSTGVAGDGAEDGDLFAGALVGSGFMGL
jgi:hypothetical protein